MRFLTVFTAAAALLAAPFAMAGETPAPAGAAVYFIAPADGARSLGRLPSNSASRAWAWHRLVSRRPIPGIITC